MSTGEKLRAEGRIQGRVEGRVELLTNLLRRRFGTAADTVIDRLHAASDKQLDTWAERLLDARSLADVFGS